MRKTMVSAAALATVGVLAIGGAAAAAPATGVLSGMWGTSSTCDQDGTGRSNGNGVANGTGNGVANGTGNGMANGYGTGRAGRGGGYGTTTGSRGPGGGAGVAVPAPVAGATVSDEVAEVLGFMAQEEQLAGDVYALAASLYPDRVFTNIGASEATHLAAVRTLLDRYGIDDPTTGAAPGQYADDGLQALYDTLAAQVRVDRASAVGAGVAVEQADIADLTDAVAMDSPSDVSTVLGELLAASQRHLAAFQRNL